MDLPLCQNMSLFLTIILFILARVPTPVSAINVESLYCSAPFRCGNVDNISYPFWEGIHSESCGYPGFKLNCESDVPEITIINNTYRVLKINKTSRAVTVAREDYMDSLCPSNFVNTTLNFSLFNYAPGIENLTLYYSCPVNFKNNILRALNPFQFPCNSDDNTTTNYFYSWDVNIFNDSFSQEAEAYFSNCGNRVVIPAFKSTLESLVSNPSSVSPTRAIQEGFGLQWLADNDLCDECERSGGECGHRASARQFNCYCSDQPYPYFCPSEKDS